MSRTRSRAELASHLLDEHTNETNAIFGHLARRIEMELGWNHQQLFVNVVDSPLLVVGFSTLCKRVRRVVKGPLHIGTRGPHARETNRAERIETIRVLMRSARLVS